MKIAHKIETYTSDGEPVLRFTVMNSSGVYMEFTNWGARWITASVPDVQGALDNVLIGYDSWPVIWKILIIWGQPSADLPIV